VARRKPISKRDRLVGECLKVLDHVFTFLEREREVLMQIVASYQEQASAKATCKGPTTPNTGGPPVDIPPKVLGPNGKC
jgi:hypothetical protein